MQPNDAAARRTSLRLIGWSLISRDVGSYLTRYLSYK
jgi:hypothetical protein